MTKRGERLVVGAVVVGGVLALGCRTPSSVGTVSRGNAGIVSPAASWMEAAAPLDWSTPVAGKTHTLMPTPKTVAWGWYDAAGEPVLRVNSGDEVVLRALSTCNPTSL